MNKRFLILAAVAAVLAVGTYAGLNIVKPYKQEEPKVADVTSPDQVFGASEASPESHPEDNAAAAPAAATDAAAAAPAADTAVQPAGGEASAESAPAQTAAAATGDGSVAPLTPSDGSDAAPAAATPDNSAAAPASSDMASSEPAAGSTPAPAAESAPAAAPAPAEPAPAATETASAPAPDTAMAAPAEAPKKKVHKASKPASPKTWWPAEKAGKLSMVYAGPASFKKAIVLMFNGAFFKADSPNANIKVTDKSGKPVSGSWELGENNLRMLVFAVPAAGTYKVTVSSGLTDNKGRKLGSKLSGPVQVH